MPKGLRLMNLPGKYLIYLLTNGTEMVFGAIPIFRIHCLTAAERLQMFL